MKAHLLAQVRLAEVINRKGGVSTKLPSFYATRCHQFCHMSMSKQNIPERDRLALQVQWGNIDVNGMVIQAIVNAAIRYDQDKGDGGPLVVGFVKVTVDHLVQRTTVLSKRFPPWL